MGGGHSKLRNAFTLIELLAIIVILAIIAVITIPIILNVIDNAKSGSVIDSAYGYKDAVQKFYVSKLYEDANFKLDGEYIVNDGALNGMEIQVSGTKPVDGVLTYENNILKDGCLTFDNYKVTIEDGKMQSAEKGTCDLPPTSCYLDKSYYSPESWFTFGEANNPGKITGYTGGNDKKVRIPCFKEDGTPITLIGQSAFGGTTLDEVVIPDSVYAYEGAFGGATINNLIVGDSIPAYMLSGPLGSVNNIYNAKGKNLDWNLVLNGNTSGEKFASGTVTRRGTQIVNIISDKVEQQNAKHSIIYVDNNGTKYYDSKWVGQNPVYFDPTGTNLNCTVEDYNNNTEKLGKTGCMKWYAYSENNNGTINMILDHNTSTTAWVSRDDYNGTGDYTASSVGLTYPNGIQGTDDYGSTGNWNKGPITLLGKLKNDTNSWTSTVISRDNYGIYTNKNKYYDSLNLDNPNYTINYSGYNARLITAQEIAYLTKNSTSNEWTEKTATSQLVFDIDEIWLFENGSSWTVSSNAGDFDSTCLVSSYGGINSNDVYYSSFNGARPVITVSNSVLSGS